ncbi:hypothetical protein, partial [Bacillus pseudomycoides]|uniref:hypothetical protein n=1 Tax=Bacillus pseudomycoides TaxID=64104 RepID=UPI0020D28343
MVKQPYFSNNITGIPPSKLKIFPINIITEIEITPAYTRKKRLKIILVIYTSFLDVGIAHNSFQV